MKKQLQLLCVLVCLLVSLTNGHEMLAQVKYVYIIPSAHNDVGFDQPPTIMAEHSVADIDWAIDAAKNNAEVGHTVWNIETFWQLSEWMKAHTDQAERDELINLIKTERIGLSAGYICAHQCFLNDFLMDHNFKISTEWGTSNGINLNWVMSNDCPDHHPAYPSYLAKYGIKHIIFGMNQSSTPDIDEQYSNTPFWWKSTDGKDSVLTFMCAQSYTEAYNRYGMDPNTTRFHKKSTYPELTEMSNLEVTRFFMDKTLQEFADKNYPYDAVAGIHAFDDWGTKRVERLNIAAKEFNDNRRPGDPEIIIGTPGQFLQHIEDNYADDLPSYSGGNGGLWAGVRRRNPVLTMRSIYEANRLAKANNPSQADIENLLTFYGHTDAQGGYSSGQMDSLYAEQHYHEFHQMGNNWESSEDIIASWPSGTPYTLPKSNSAKYEHNALYLSTKGGTTEICPANIWLGSSVEKLSDNRVIVRHTIDRSKLPEDGTFEIFWYWNIQKENIGEPINILQAGGPWVWGQKHMGALPNTFFAPYGLYIGKERFISHSGLFDYTLRNTQWIVASILKQTLWANYRDDGPPKKEWSSLLPYDVMNFHSPAIVEIAMEIDYDFNIDNLLLSSDKEEMPEINCSIYPTLANNVININTQEIVDGIEIFNMNGSHQLVSLKSDKVIDISKFDKGVYLVRIMTNKGSKTLKFIKS